MCVYIGLTTHAILRPSRILFNFESGGWNSQVRSNVYELIPDADVVAFDNLPKDDHGYHHGISVSEVGTCVCVCVCVCVCKSRRVKRVFLFPPM